LLGQLSGKLADSNRLRMHAPLPLEQRLAVYLSWRLQKDGQRFNLENREVLAALLDTSTRHLNRSLKQLEALGVLQHRNKTVTIVNTYKLTSLTQDPAKKKT
jgi:CRP-like cAMP-binding protein